MPSFDVVSRINYQEFDNALGNCLREIGTRYDFKGLNISIERKDKTITTLAPDNLKLKIQVKIQGEELRADGKKRDDLQEAIAAIRTIDIGQPMEFVNFRD